MRGLARHARPHFLAVGTSTRANRVNTREEKERERACLQERNESKPENERRVADMDRPDSRLDYRRVLPIERGDVASEPLVSGDTRVGALAARGQLVEWRVDRASELSVSVGEQNRNLRVGDLAREFE